MALPVINPGIAQMDPNSSLYALYTRFYENMVLAASIDTPDITPTSAEIQEDGTLSAAYYARVEAAMASYKEITMKNTAYGDALSIMLSIGGGGGGGSPIVDGYVARIGDSMLGLLQAKYGFEAGYADTKIFDTAIITENEGTENEADVNVAHVYGRLLVDENLDVTGKIIVGDDGLFFGANQTLYKDNSGKIVLKGTNIKLDGAIAATGNITRGDIVIASNSIYNGNNVYYHAGNSNIATVDWTAKDLIVAGDAAIAGDSLFGGFLSALYGFSLGADSTALLQSVVVTESDVVVDKYINLKSFVSLDNGTGLKYNSHPILKAYVGPDSNPRVDFGAPGMKLYLGAPDGATATSRIILQAPIYNYDNTYRIISQYGDGNFPNSFSAGCANSGPTVMQTYYTSASDCGVVFLKNIRLGSSNGPILATDSYEKQAVLTLPHVHVVSSTNTTEHLPVKMYFDDTDSVFADQSLSWSASLNIDLDNANAEFFSFKKPVEAPFFSIEGSTYKTKLGENVLSFADGVFLEGVNGGIYHSGNATFSASIGSTAFASGFAGYGWAVMSNLLYGGYEATFDTLTVRKKMRVYELEVQKITATNGSLWVSDACSGDSVTELV